MAKGGYQVKQKEDSYKSESETKSDSIMEKIRIIKSESDSSMESAKSERKRSKSKGPHRCNGRSSVHTIKSMELERFEIDDHYSEVRLLAEGWNATVYSGYHNSSNSRLALKCVNKDGTKKKDFLKEIHYNYYLSPHPNIITSYNVAFDTEQAYVFAQELAPEGDMLQFLERQRITESQAKSVLEQVTFALEFIHSKDIVHREICLDNILVFSKDLTTVKLGDYGETHRAGSLVKKLPGRSQWSAPEVCRAVYNERFEAHTSQDAWELGILIFVLMTGIFPWETADITDKDYNAWTDFLKRKTNTIPKRFRTLTPRLLRLLRKLLEPKSEKRAQVSEVYKYLNDVWLIKHNSETHSESLLPCQDNCDSNNIFFGEDAIDFCGISNTVNQQDTNRRVSQWLLDTSPVIGGYSD